MPNRKQSALEWCRANSIYVRDQIEVQSCTGAWIKFNITAFGAYAVLGHVKGCQEIAFDDASRMRLVQKRKVKKA